MRSSPAGCCPARSSTRTPRCTAATTRPCTSSPSTPSTKGTANPQQTVVSAESGASCGLELHGDGPFLVLANTEPDGRLAAGLCGGSTSLTSELEAEVRSVVALPEGLPLTPPETPLPGSLPARPPVGMTTTEPPAGTALALEVAAGVAALFAGVLVVRRRRRASRR
jgi:hypothetical protein